MFEDARGPKSEIQIPKSTYEVFYNKSATFARPIQKRPPCISMTLLPHPDRFIRRHIGPSASETEAMLKTLNISSLDELIAQTVPKAIRLQKPLELPEPLSEFDYLEDLKSIARLNKVTRNFIGMGYYGTITPAVILRNVFQNPGWYTQYTPYQAEIAQGRLESLLNFQTMVSDLTALPIANASLL